MTDHERTLRRLAVGDDQLVASILAQSDPIVGGGPRDEQMRPLLRLAALIAGGGTCASYQSVIESALAAGASVGEIIGVLLAVAETVGSARVVAAAPLLARAVGFDVDEAFDNDDRPSSVQQR
jgi:4-carboxymuconolactone decarboxylase